MLGIRAGKNREPLVDLGREYFLEIRAKAELVGSRHSHWVGEIL